MTVTTLSSRQFNQDTAGAKRAAEAGPVIITDRGRPSHVLLAFEAYADLTKSRASIIDLLWHPEGADLEFDPPKMNLVLKPAVLD